MRILWSSNSPLAPTGYGSQTASACQWLKKLGHEVAIFAFFGMKGCKTEWGGIDIYPNDADDFGVKNALMFYEDFKADILICLVDVWVLAGMDPTIKWVPWLPIDHDPPPPAIIDILKKHPGIVKPIVQSKFGQRKLKEAGIDSYYIPNDFDTELFSPKPDQRKIGRETYGWNDKFVIGTVATNHAERKNFIVAMKAVSIFNKMHPGEIIFYTHTNPVDPRGINLVTLREALQLEDVIRYPSRVQLATGIDRGAMVGMYNSFDVFLLPSKGEGFCRPIVEAQACGCPIITTKCTSHAEVCGGVWFIKDLIPTWTLQNSWQFDCTVEETVARLEQAYQAKKDGSIKKKQKLARKKALEYDEMKLYKDYWPPVLADIEKRLKSPRNLEGIQPWRLNLIPQACIPRRVLDIGCGITKPYKKELERLGEYVGVDNRGGKGIVKADAHKLPFSDKAFGFVWMSELLEHVTDPAKVIAEAKRVGVHGVCLFSTPENPFFKGDPDHKIVKDVPYATLQSGDGLIQW